MCEGVLEMMKIFNGENYKNQDDSLQCTSRKISDFPGGGQKVGIERYDPAKINF